MKNEKNNKHKGQGWHGNIAAHKIAGSKGGAATSKKYGNSFYKRIGGMGGKVSRGNFKNDRKRAQAMGRIGGELGGKLRSKKVAFQ